MMVETVYRDMEEEFEKNHPLLTEMYEKYKTFQDISDEWGEIKKPIIITETSDRTEADYERANTGVKVIK